MKRKTGDEAVLEAPYSPAEEASQLMKKAATLLRLEPGPDVFEYTAAKLDVMVSWLEGTWETRLEDSSS